MQERKDTDKKRVNTQDGSEKIHPDNEKDFAGTEKARKTRNTNPTEETNEWESREDESRAP